MAIVLPILVQPEGSVPVSSLYAMCASLADLDAFVPLKECVIDLKNASTRDFLLHVVAEDGRTWKQHLFLDPHGISMTFSVPDKWLISESVRVRALRDIAMSVLLAHPTVTRIKFPQ